MCFGSDDDYIWGSKDGCMKICYYKLVVWIDDNMFYQVIMKGLIWLEVYEVYFCIGNFLSDYLQYY